MQDRSIGGEGLQHIGQRRLRSRVVGRLPLNRRSATRALHEPAQQTTRPSAVRLLLTPTEAAEQLAVSRTKVYELMAAGILRSIQIGRLRRVPVDALHEFIEVGELR